MKRVPQPSFLRRALALLILIPFSLPTLHAQVQQMNLQQMVDAAGTIVIGTAIWTRGGVDEHGDIVTYTSFLVEETLKGKPGSSLMIKQFGGETEKLSFRIEHMRYFIQGERVMVMLYPVSELGFTSPVGLSQAVWRVNADGTVDGISDEALHGLAPLMKKYGVKEEPVQSLRRGTFVSMVNDLLKGGAR